MTDEPDKARAKHGRDAKGRWQPGVSGNPSGLERGSRHRATLAVEELLDGEAEALTRKAVELAKAGDTTALRLCLERLLPPRKGRPVHLDLPKIETARDVLAALAATVQAMAGGDLTPDEAAVVAGVLDAKRRALETVEIERRLAELERPPGG